MFRYGDEFRSLWQSDEVKYITFRDPDDSLRMPRETRTPGRVYALVGADGNVKSIGIYDQDGKIAKQIDLDHFHAGQRPHIHRDTWHHDEGPKLNAAEKGLLKRIQKNGATTMDNPSHDFHYRRAPNLQTEEDWRVLLEDFGHIWFVLDGQRYFVFPEGSHQYGLCLGEDEETGNFARWTFESEDEFLNARLFGGRSILERLDEVMVYDP